MKKMKLALVGFRGMVGSVLLSRMKEENDFNYFETTFFSSSLKGQKIDREFESLNPLSNEFQDSYDVSLLAKHDIILTCQGGDYTKEVYASLMNQNFKGYWIDAASALRMDKNAVIVLDPLNLDVMKNSLASGGKLFVGGNCTVSLMLLACGGLFQNNLVEWVTSMTYQAASGAGAKNMEELLMQMKALGNFSADYKTKNPSASILDLEKSGRNFLQTSDFPKTHFGHPLASNLLPWIDSELKNGQSREEWKAQVEANKILQTKKEIPIDGTCVRIGALRSHSQGLTVKLNKSVSLNEIESMIKSHNEWVHFVPNHKEVSMRELTPEYISGTLKIGVGRVRKMSMGDDFLNIFTVGDQLMWGAAEPLRRTLRLLLEN